MKRVLNIACRLLFLGAILSFNACSDSSDDEIYFNETLLVGKWQCGTLFDKYESDHTGGSWDENPKYNLTEADAQPFRWTLTADNLEQIHIMEVGGEIPKSYTVIELNNTTLVYEDCGVSKTFTRVN